MSRRSSIAAALLLVALLAAPAAAPGQLGRLGGLGGLLGGGGVVELEVSGNRAEATLSLLGLGLDFTLEFEDVSGLTAGNLGLSAQLVSVTDLLGRLESGTLLSGGLPLLVTLEPPAAGGLSFHGTATVDVHTHVLHFLPGSRLRLFKAPLGGAFVDITESMGAGSYRARGRCGGFSQFLILVDLRPTPVAVDGKLTRLADLLATHDGQITPTVADALAAALEAVEDEWAAGDEAGAIVQLDAFTALVETHSGGDIPDLWRAARDVDNVAGELRAAAATLRFSLALAAD
jgi:hypothetical protein